MFNTAYIGNIPKNILESQRVDLEPNLSGMFKVLFRSLTSNMTEDELYTDKSSIASVMLLNDILSRLNITNAVSLIINEKVIFEDLHGIDDDLSEMIEKAEKISIDRLESATIVMESHIYDLHFTYEFTISKESDESVTIIISVNADVEEQGGSDKESFEEEVDCLIDICKDFGIKFKNKKEEA